MGGDYIDEERKKTMFMVGMMMGLQYVQNICEDENMTKDEKKQVILQYGLASLDYLLRDYYKDRYYI